MRCINPVSITVPVKDNDVEIGKQDINVRCGKCLACLQLRRLEWFVRLGHEYKYSDNAYFVTLTYSDENLYYNEYGVPSVCYRDIQLFHKRLRKLGRFRYYLASEYGTRFGRPHYHGIYFNLSEEQVENIEMIWGKGFVHVGEVTSRSINYVSGYIIMMAQIPEKATKPFSVMSRRPGIGQTYLDRNGQWHQENNEIFVRDINGRKVYMPRFYRNKLFSSLRRQAFALSAIEAYEDQYLEAINALAVMNPDRDPVQLYKDLEKNNLMAILRKRTKNTLKSLYF